MKNFKAILSCFCFSYHNIILERCELAVSPGNGMFPTFNSLRVADASCRFDISCSMFFFSVSSSAEINLISIFCPAFHKLTANVKIKHIVFVLTTRHRNS